MVSGRGAPGLQEARRRETASMRDTVPAVRKAAIVLVAASSVVCALGLVWGLGARDHIGLLSNGHLLGMLAMLLLPGATAAAWEMDRRAVVKAGASRRELEELGRALHDTTHRE